MAFSRRHLPHLVPEEATVFVTWCLAGSVPWRADAVDNRAVAVDNRTDAVDNRTDAVDILAASFLQHEAKRDCYDRGPFWLQDRRVARVVVDALRYGESVRQFYHLYAWVVMSNHVHVIFQPRVEMLGIMRWLKGRTARQANRILGLTGTAFWHNESFDHWIRTKEEPRDLIAYVENNPVKAGLVGEACQWPWSSAGDDRRQKTIVCPTLIAP
jgi:REP element-mobilizing transposase RayT